MFEFFLQIKIPKSNPLTFVLAKWMVTGHSGLPGRSVHRPVARATKQGSGAAVTHLLSMGVDLVWGRQWRLSCVVSDPVQVGMFAF